MIVKEIWVNPHLTRNGKLQIVHTNDPNRHLMVGEEGYEKFVSEASIKVLQEDFQKLKESFAKAQEELRNVTKLAEALV